MGRQLRIFPGITDPCDDIVFFNPVADEEPAFRQDMGIGINHPCSCKFMICRLNHQGPAQKIIADIDDLPIFHGRYDDGVVKPANLQGPGPEIGNVDPFVG